MVALPGIGFTDAAADTLNYLERRRGGGGGGRGGGGGGKSSGSKGGGKSGGGKSGGGKSSGSKSSGGKSGGKGSRGVAAGGFAFGAGAGVACSSCSVHPYAWGGGHSRPIQGGAPFAGRLSGGGTRDQIYGTSRYGSGYPYGESGDVSSRPFPFAFWPVPIAVGYFGADTYINYADNVRPGGDIKVLPVQSSLGSTPETYYLVGDRSSLQPVLSALRDDCSVKDASLGDFDPRSSDPTRVIQWYRASSFALALPIYSNLASSPANMSLPTLLPSSMDTPLPQGLNQTFLACVNTTIGASVPLITPAKKLSGGAIAGIVLGAVFGALILVMCLWWFIPWCIKRQRRRKMRTEQKRIAEENKAYWNNKGHQGVNREESEMSQVSESVGGTLVAKNVKDVNGEKAHSTGSSEGLIQMPQPEISQPTTAMLTPDLAMGDKKLSEVPASRLQPSVSVAEKQ